MNQYSISISATDKEGKAVELLEEVRAGDLAIESGCLIFRKTVASNDIVMGYKTWNKVKRIAVNV